MILILISGLGNIFLADTSMTNCLTRASLHLVMVGGMCLNASTIIRENLTNI